MRFRRSASLAAATFAALAAGATVRAQTPPKACASAATQSEMTECADKAFRKADQELNDSYKTIEARLKGDAEKMNRLVTAQRAWIVFRDAECNFAASNVAGGSAYPMTVALCAEAMTNHRLQDLKAYLKCEEGDMSCPVPAK
ncbi:MAG: urease-associated protein [Rhizobiales bacterium 65-9]|nr:DUF1311 domain-containing protein [Hyphomicrobiales bacterium]OJY37303.1 MAG: urease-associated protein [Rhizobiales bacterium 65-9]